MTQQAVQASKPSQFSTIRPKDEDAINLSEYLDVVIDAKKIIIATTLIGFGLALLYAFIATPQYEANAMVQVEDSQGAGLSALEGVSGLFEGESSIETEIQLLKSRMVLGKAGRQLGLDISVTPEYFPVVGQTLARRFEKNYSGVAKPFFGLSSYAWGGESLNIDVFEIPQFLEGRPLQFVVKEKGAYEVSYNDIPLVSGRVGQLSQVNLKQLGDDNPLKQMAMTTENNYADAADSLVQLHVAKLVARPGTHFTILKRPLQDVATTFAKQLAVGERGKNSGILALSFMSSDRDEVANILNTIANVYVAQNVARSSAEAELSLGFLEKQLPPLKEQLDAAENAYNQFRVQHGSIDLAAETQSVLTELSAVGTKILELEQERKELRKRFKPAHPSVRALDGKIALLKKEEKRLETSSDSLPDTQRDILRLAREVEMNTVLYSKLLNTSQELKVAKAGTVGNVRVIDHAFTPTKPVKPNKKLLVIAGLFVGAFIGIFIAFVIRAVRGGIDDPDEIEKTLGIPVYASVMHSEEQNIVNKNAKSSGGSLGILVERHPDSLTVECLRSLRTSLHFSLQNAENNVILIAGSSTAIGKTFTSVNLGAVLAEAGRKVLIIDADLRRGTVHRYVGYDREIGLSDLIIEGDLDPTEVIKPTTIDNLHVVTTGEFPASPAELLLHSDFERKLKVYSELYDYVIIDGPPILAVTDSAIIGRYAGTTLMVAKANYHQTRELEQAHRQFLQAGIEVKGVVFNDVRHTASARRSGRYVYRYEYKTE